MKDTEELIGPDTERVFAATGRRTKRILPGSRYVPLPDDLNAPERRWLPLASRLIFVVLVFFLIAGCAWYLYRLLH